MKRLIVWLLTLTMTAGLLTGCESSLSIMDSNFSDSSGMKEEAVAAGSPSTDSMSEEMGLEGSEAVMKPQDDRKIIYNADLSLESKQFSAAQDALLQAAAKAGAYVQNSDEGGSEESGSRWVNYTFRVPSSSYREFLSGAVQAGNVLNKSESTEDVTAEYVDVQARLESLEKQEARLLELAAKAETLEDLLAIENQLTDVRYRIESYTGQKKVMDNLIAYSTVDVSLSEVQNLTPQSRSFTSRLGRAFKGSWQNFMENLQDIIISLIYLLPTLVLLAAIVAIVLVIVRKAGKRQAEKRKNMPVPPVPPVEPGDPAPKTETGKNTPVYGKKG